MQAVLLVTVLAPAAVFAGPLTTHQTSAPTQTQDQPRRLNRGLILGTADAAESRNSNAQRPIVIPDVTAPTVPAPASATTAKIDTLKVDVRSLPVPRVEAPTTQATSNAPSFETAATEPRTSTIVTLPAPAPAPQPVDNSTSTVTPDASTPITTTTTVPVAPAVEQPP